MSHPFSQRRGKRCQSWTKLQKLRKNLKLQKLLQLRPLRDSFFAHRERPCLQHQIKRCSAPCVQLIGTDEYARDVNDAKRLLGGQADDIVQQVTRRVGGSVGGVQKVLALQGPSGLGLHSQKERGQRKGPAGSWTQG